MSLAMVKGLATNAPPSVPASAMLVLPARRSELVPRVTPHHSWLVETVGWLALSTAGSGAVPSIVWPYQILFIACASAMVAHVALVLVPTTPPSALTPAQSTAGSF